VLEPPPQAVKVRQIIAIKMIYILFFVTNLCFIL